MRKITREAVSAFLADRSFSNNNTQIIRSNGEIGQVMRLHGNPVAFKRDGAIYIQTCGYDTTTTKERLNGVLEGAMTPHRVYSHKGDLHLGPFEWYGEAIRINANNENLVDYDHGWADGIRSAMRDGRIVLDARESDDGVIRGVIRGSVDYLKDYLRKLYNEREEGFYLHKDYYLPSVMIKPGRWGRKRETVLLFWIFKSELHSKDIFLHTLCKAWEQVLIKEDE